MISIKHDLFETSDIVIVSYEEGKKEITLFFKCGAVLIYGLEFIAGRIIRDRVITKDEFEKIKDYFRITKKAEVVV